MQTEINKESTADEDAVESDYHEIDNKIKNRNQPEHTPQCQCNQGGVLKRTYGSLFPVKITHEPCVNFQKGSRYQSIPGNGEAVYQVLIQIQLEGPKFTRSKQQIKLDVKRTFPDVTYFSEGDGRKVLKRMLLAFAKYNPNLGYVQGMNFIAGALLWHTTEVQAFWLFVGLIDEYRLADNFSEDLPGIDRHCHITDFLLIEYLPRVYEHISRYGIMSHMIITDGCFVLFMNLVPIEQSGWILNKFFKYRGTFLYKLILEILARLEHKILKCENTVEILSVLKPYQSAKEARQKFIKALENGRGRLNWHKLVKCAKSRYIDENCIKTMMGEAHKIDI